MTITKLPNFLSRSECACLLRKIFDRRALWENRATRKVPYRNGNWYTLGATLYLDLPSAEFIPQYQEKIAYFNAIFMNSFYPELDLIRKTMEISWAFKEVLFLPHHFGLSSFPGFHIFAPEETLEVPFAHAHTDIQWQALFNLPGFNFKLDKKASYPHFTFTLPLAIPTQGAGMLIPAVEGSPPTEPYMYDVGTLYFHSGQFPHVVMPLQHPVNPMDWRITLQGHGFMSGGKAYLYW
jgi:hypothetical protein